MQEHALYLCKGTTCLPQAKDRGRRTGASVPHLRTAACVADSWPNGQMYCQLQGSTVGSL